MIMAGGTGGHVFPGLAVARCLHEQHVHVAWLGTRKGLEAKAVPAAGLDINMEWISIRGVRRRGILGWLLLPFKLAYAVGQAFRILRRCKPQVVLSMGGFVAGPGGIVAWLTRTPLLIHEQNAIPGLTNKWLAVIADQVLSGFPGAFGGLTTSRHAGNPVRREIAALPPPEARLAGHSGRLRLLVIGGSQGARIFNEILPAVIRLLPADVCPEVWHQCGRGAQAQTEAAYQSTPLKVRVSEFIDDMSTAYEWADVVLCRAGAMTIAELAASGSASILVPYPHAVDDHQTSNANFLVERGAAVLLPQKEFTPAAVCELLQYFTENRGLALKMAMAARGCAITDAADTVARLCLEVMHA